MQQENKSNRLINEKSPYLIQHAYNPINWYPWGEEAFEDAKKEDKPIFLSIGYSTCHWCNVMAHESFEDENVAAILNKFFISIKLDREERPDVDSVYMTVCQALTGSGGWPLTIIMTPNQKPFFAGTYFPKTSTYGMPGLIEILESVATQWKNSKEKLINSSDNILKELGKFFVSESNDTKLSEKNLKNGYNQLLKSFDIKYGGFSPAPKFPTPHKLMFLLRYYKMYDETNALEMVETTLGSMYRGGLFDHIGYGFSRYSTDDKYLVPHFEKMLYDNALLALAYVGAFGLTGRELYGGVARKILAYVGAELTDAQGGFYCGQDADSDGVEGKYYVFTPKEICRVLGENAGTAFCDRYGITEHGNFEGKSIPNLLGNEAYEEDVNAGYTKAEQAKKELTIADLQKLYEYRLQRTRLHKDDKILVSWNGWMICACAKAGAVLGETEYVDLAVRAEAFIRKNLARNGRLMVRYRDGDAAGEGKLDDYACYILALLELYRVTFQEEYLARASAWAETMIEQFFDRERGGFYLTAKDGEQLIVRTKETYDGAMPSGNSAAARGLQQLVQITGESKWQEILDQQLHYLAGAMEGYPSGHSYALLTMMNVLYPSKELVCTISPAVRDTEQKTLLNRLAYLSETVPGLAVVVKTADNEMELAKLAPYTRDYLVPEDGMLFYLCSGSRCLPPVEKLEQLTEKWL